MARAVQKCPTEAPLLREELNIVEDGTEPDVALVGEALKRRRLISKQTVSEVGREEVACDEHRKKHFGARLKEVFVELGKKLLPG